MQSSSVLAMPVRPPEPVAISPVQDGERVHGFDVLRFFAVCAIVWFHVGAPLSAYFAWRLPSLLTLSVFLAATHRRSEGVGLVAGRRARRLLLPFLFWSGVYAGLVGYRIVGLGAAPGKALSAWMLVGGTSRHLWFLPFAFASGVFAVLASRLTARKSAATAVSAWLTVSVVVLVVSTAVAGSNPNLPWPIPQYLYGLPALPIGLALAALHAEGGAGEERRREPHLVYLLVPLVLLGVQMANLPASSTEPVATFVETTGRYGAGALAFCLVVFVPAAICAPFARFTPLAMGVYLVHPLVNLLILKTGLVGAATAAHGVLVVAASVVAAWGISRTPLKRFI